MKVKIDGVVYVPRAEIPPLTDERLRRALQELTSIQYFNIEHKNRAVAWDALNALSPELAELASRNPKAAFDRVHDIENDDLGDEDDDDAHGD
jgi:hypothetical protein